MAIKNIEKRLEEALKLLKEGHSPPARRLLIEVIKTIKADCEDFLEEIKEKFGKVHGLDGKDTEMVVKLKAIIRKCEKALK